jgi:hypothetical protein
VFHFTSTILPQPLSEQHQLHLLCSDACCFSSCKLLAFCLINSLTNLWYWKPPIIPFSLQLCALLLFFANCLFHNSLFLPYIFILSCIFLKTFILILMFSVDLSILSTFFPLNLISYILFLDSFWISTEDISFCLLFSRKWVSLWKPWLGRWFQGRVLLKPVTHPQCRWAIMLTSQHRFSALTHWKLRAVLFLRCPVQVALFWAVSWARDEVSGPFLGGEVGQGELAICSSGLWGLKPQLKTLPRTRHLNRGGISPVLMSLVV